MTTLGYYSGPIDGVYGDQTTAAVKEMQTGTAPETAAAVKQLQTDLGVTADGRFGPETAAAFNEAVASGELQPA
jgi:peptidoglycan hydrolase-like protein with peptidoglycan-binding domain